MTEPPAPDTCHPAYTNQAHAIRNHLHRSAVTVVSPDPIATITYPEGSDKPLTGLATARHLLTVQRCAGPAPFVGDPFWYEWKVAVDVLDRHVAGPTEIVHAPWHEVFRHQAALRAD